MNLSGVIFVVLAIAWAVYLIPKALRHHDEVARDRSVDRFSTAMRVLGHHEHQPTDQPSALRAQSLAPVPVAAPTPVRERRSPAVRRAAARAAAQRRRRILTGLLGIDVLVAILAALSVLVAWSVAVPVALTGLYLVLCRTQVRREDDASWVATSSPAEDITEVAEVVEVSPDEDTVALETAELRRAVGDPFGYAEMETVAVSADLVNGGSLWDPLPVTLPTYVGKAKAARTVRTIDLNEPNIWSSGRSESDSQLVADAAVAAEEAAAADSQAHRAVGS